MLTYDETALIRRATYSVWTLELNEKLALAVVRRGGLPQQHNTCGDLVEYLEALAAEPPR